MTQPFLLLKHLTCSFIPKRNLMNKKISITLIFSLLAAIIFAQNDIVYLKDGSIIHGKIVEKNDSTLRLKALNEHLWLIPQAQILKFELESDEISTDSVNYIVSFELGLSVGKNSPLNYIPNFYFINGLRFHNHFSVGLGTGIDFADVPILPVFADFRYKFLNRKKSPVAFVQAGYAWALSEHESFYQDWNEKGGYLLSAGIGGEYKISNSLIFSLSVAYHYQKLASTYTSDWWEIPEQTIERNYYYRRVIFRFGLMF